jgi:protocadherin-15
MLIEATSLLKFQHIHVIDIYSKKSGDCLILHVLNFHCQDRARNMSERFSTTTTLTVNVRDDDDQNPSFIYQGCMLHEGSCINPEYSTSVSKGKVLFIFSNSREYIHVCNSCWILAIFLAPTN